MSAPKWTPRPWSAIDEREDRIVIRGPNDEYIADCCDGHWTDAEEFVRAAESAPNANLMAAAPDLAEACEDAVTILERFAADPADCVRRLQAWLPKGHAALDKAKGES